MNRYTDEKWVRRMLPIVGELEEHIRYDWEHNDCVQIGKLKLIFDTFFEFPPEHDWLETLISDAVDVQNENGWDLSYGERLDFEVMARAFNLELADAA